MKNRFSTLDLCASIAELQEKYQGMRVMNIYDVDNKTYLIKLARPEKKAMILIESGIRIHSTDFEWPKNITPSSFSMKLRKHLRTRRLETITQLGVDRIIDIQFGSNEAAYHIILELYDRGNIVLTDHEYMILNILRPRTDQSEDVCLAVHHKYPVESAKQDEGPITQEKLMSILMANEGADLKKTLNPSLIYGPALIEHSLLNAGIKQNARIGKDFHISEDITKLMAALDHADSLMKMAKKCCKGYIIQKKEKKISMKAAEEPDELLTYSEFHPLLFKQHENQSYIELESFDKAVDEFFSKIGSQKLDMKVLQQEKAALKKLEHIKKDHEKRLMSLKQEQDIDMNKGQLIEMNLDLVDRAILIIRSAIANQTDWNEIHTIVKEAQIQGDPVASSIKSLKLDTNHITMFLKNPYLDSDEEESSDNPEAVTPMNVDIDLELSAYGNARKYFDKKRKAAAKEQKTVDASTKALKSAERKTFQTLKEVQTVATINKARKTYWFEKFLWFISSENYVVIGGRDQQQNEFIVKKYLRPGDIYVHADIHGASSVVIKNPSGEPIPPKTLNEAGTMALCNSAAWDARVVTSAWWVYHHQVSKTAPTGEYLTTGSFMIRGKKNFLPPSYLVYGFGFLFKIDEDSLFRHKGERRVRSTDDEVDMKAESETMESEVTPQSKHADPQSGQNTNSSSDSEIHSDDATNVDGSRSGNNMVEERTSTIKEDTEENELPKSVREMSLQSDNKSEIVLSSATNQSGSDHQESKAREESSSDGIKTSKLEEDTLNDSDMSDEGNLFPDTNIELQYTKGEKFQIQLSRMVSSQSTAADGDIEADAARPTSANKCGAKLSAKQRRELRKKRAKEVQKQSTGPETEVELSSKTLDQEQAGPSTHSQKQVKTKQQSLQEGIQPQPTVLKRGQKSKLKKIKEKYKDQDEEERELRMKILASAGPSKEDKKKAKKGKQQGHSLSAPNKKQPQGQGQKVHPGRKLTIEDIKEESAIITQDFQGEKAKTEEDLSDEEKQVLLEEENIQIGQEMNELDLLTGMPVPEDVLHFCIPVCAPYSAILNYKFKVKLTPGTTKRGKAAKAALHSFMSDKNTTNREKDLFKSLKDVDLSRNIPGKVKVSAPNLLKYKKK